MKKFLFKAALLVLPFLVLVVAFELRYAGADNNEYIVKRRLIEQAAPRIEVLCLGSSHGYYGLLPDHLGGRAFNLAANGQSLYYDAALIHKYAPLLPALKTVILPVSDFSLEVQMDQSPEPWRCYYYYMYYAIPHRDPAMASSVRNFSRYFLEDRYFPFYRSRLVDSNMAARFDALGGVTNDDTPVPSPEDFRGSAQRAIALRDELMHPDNIPGNVAILEELAGYLEAHHIRLALLTTPARPEFRRVLHPDAYARMQSTLAAFSQKHGITYLNYLDDPRFSAPDFRDSHHLSYRGAVKFSEIVSHDILGLPEQSVPKIEVIRPSHG